MSDMFAHQPDLRARHAMKWSAFDEDILPLWVADMDFQSPPAVIEALTARVQAGTFGYTMDYPPLREAIVERMARLYDWHIEPQDIVFVPGMVVTLNMITRAFGKAGDGVLMQTPVYGPFLSVPAHNGKFAQTVDLVQENLTAHTFAYRQDTDAFARAITRQSSLFYLCNPHNPGGMVYSRAELEALATLCLKNNVTIVSDEIHSDLILEGAHIPIATLSPEVAQRTITLIAPSKTFNLPALTTSIAIVQNKDMRERLTYEVQRTGLHVNILGLVAADAAYRGASEWLAGLLGLLRANRDKLVGYVGEPWQDVRVTVPQATYLAYLDFSALATPEDVPPAQFFLERARVALNNGDFFRNVNATSGRDNYVRLNFGCAPATLEAALARMTHAMREL